MSSQVVYSLELYITLLHASRCLSSFQALVVVGGLRILFQELFLDDFNSDFNSDFNIFFSFLVTKAAKGLKESPHRNMATGKMIELLFFSDGLQRYFLSQRSPFSLSLSLSLSLSISTTPTPSLSLSLSPTQFLTLSFSTAFSVFYCL